MSYRDDLDAALARNHALARRVNELEGALQGRQTARPKPRPAAPPAKPRRPAKAPSSSSRIVYAAPATYVPFVRQYGRYVSLTWRDLRSRLPSLDVPMPAPSNIIVVELLRRLLLVAWIPLAFAFQVVWLVLGVLWFAISVPVVGAMTLVATPVVVPIVVLASLRTRQRGTTALLEGVRWGATPTDESAGFYASMCAATLLFLAMPVTAIVFALAT